MQRRRAALLSVYRSYSSISLVVRYLLVLDIHAPDDAGYVVSRFSVIWNTFTIYIYISVVLWALGHFYTFRWFYTVGVLRPVFGLGVLTCLISTLLPRRQG